MPKIATEEQLASYHILNEAWVQAQKKYNSLLSQGKHCPPDILEDAKRFAELTHLAYINYRNLIWPEPTIGEFLYIIAPRVLWAVFCFTAAWILYREL